LTYYPGCGVVMVLIRNDHTERHGFHVRKDQQRVKALMSKRLFTMRNNAESG